MCMYAFKQRQNQQINECGGILAYIGSSEAEGDKSVKKVYNGVSFGQQFADLLRKQPYYQCGIALKSGNKVNTAKFMSKGRLHQNEVQKQPEENKNEDNNSSDEDDKKQELMQ